MPNFSGLESDEIKLVAFDLGGVLAYRDLSVLSAYEQNFLLFYQKYRSEERRVGKECRL